MKNYGIYKMVFTDGSFYIGSSMNFRKRFSSHKSSLRHGRSTNILQDAFKINGPPMFVVLASLLDGEVLKQKEKRLIRELQPPLNINLK